MESGKITNSQLQSSSHYTFINPVVIELTPQQARLNSQLVWEPTYSVSGRQWIQVDFINPVKMTHILTQGIPPDFELFNSGCIEAITIETGNNVNSLVKQSHAGDAGVVT